MTLISPDNNEKANLVVRVEYPVLAQEEKVRLEIHEVEERLVVKIRVILLSWRLWLKKKTQSFALAWGF